MIGLGLRLGASGHRSFTPASVSSLAAWLRGDTIVTSGSAVTSWTDKSGSGRHATQGTAAAQPVLVASSINSLPAVQFDGNDDVLSFGASTFSALTGGELFIVGRVNADPPALGNQTGIATFGSAADAAHLPFTDGTVYETFGSTTRHTVGNPAASLAEPFIYNVTSVAGELTARLNGTQIYTNAVNTVGWSAAPTIGQSLPSSGAWLQGVLAEVIVYGAKLSTTDRTNVQAYLASRYGITVA